MEIVPRYEFRVWDVDLESIRERLLAQGSLYERRHSSETYVVSRVEDINVKVRAGVVDIKQLLVVRGVLERWKPVFKAAFPLDGRVVESSVLGPLGASPIEPIAGAIDEAGFITAAQRIDGVAVVQVRKDRSLVSFGLCRGETSLVQIDGTIYESVAVESADPSAVEAVVADLGIDRRPNESYPAMIRGLRWA
ncbi:MAG: hypothetical protein WAM81_00715 [Acidimicrobiia bacterium]